METLGFALVGIGGFLLGIAATLLWLRPGEPEWMRAEPPDPLADRLATTYGGDFPVEPVRARSNVAPLVRPSETSRVLGMPAWREVDWSPRAMAEETPEGVRDIVRRLDGAKGNVGVLSDDDKVQLRAFLEGRLQPDADERRNAMHRGMDE